MKWQFNIHANYYPIVIECIPSDERLRYTHAHVTLAYIEKSQTILNTAQVQINTATLTTAVANVTNETTTTMPSNNVNTHNLSAKALSMGCISQISYSYQIKSIKQKQLINGVLFSLQEIYGIEKKCSDEFLSNSNEANEPENGGESYDQDEAEEDSHKRADSLYKKANSEMSNRCISIETTNVSNDTITTTSSSTTRMNQECQQDKEQELKGVECVICMCESRDTLILPCRHLCLCKMCAMNLRVQSNNCPICRIPFIALIQVKLFRKKEAAQPNGCVDTRKKPAAKNDLDSKINSAQLPKVKLESLNNLATEEEYDDDENVSRVVATSLASERMVVNGKLDESVIIQIKNRTVTNETDGQQHKEVLMTCENNNNRAKKLTDLYECVTLYDAFNYRDIVSYSNSAIPLSTKSANVDMAKKAEKTPKRKKNKNPSSGNSNQSGKNFGKLRANYLV